MKKISLMICLITWATLVKAQVELYYDKKPNTPQKEAKKPSVTLNDESKVELPFFITVGLRPYITGTSLITDPPFSRIQSFGNYTTVPMAGFAGTFVTVLDIKRSSLSFQVEVGYKQRRNRFDFVQLLTDTLYENTMNLQYIHLPVLLRYDFLGEEPGEFGLYVVGGFEFNFLQSAYMDVRLPRQLPEQIFRFDIRNAVIPREANIMMGGGIRLPIKDDIELVGDMRFSNVKFNKNGLFPPYFSRGINAYHITWQLGVGLNFLLY
jgi:hypothetical protein